MALEAKLPGFCTSGPYISSVAWLSCLRSTSSGTLVCMRKAISYCEMRVWISGSPNFSKLCAFICDSVSSIARRCVLETPSGFFK